MGQAEGEYRGDTDVVLAAAIGHIKEEDFEEVLAKAEAHGMLDAKKYKTKLDLINDLPNLDENYKEELAEKLKDGKPAF